MGVGVSAALTSISLAELFASAANASPAWNHPFTFPAAISDGFGPRTPPAPGASSFHNGLDYSYGGVGPGTPIYSVASGIVSATGSNSGGFGNWAEIAHSGGWTSLYAHMANWSSLSPGQVISAPTLVGYIGQTGTATGPHLHIETRLANEPRDPQLLIHHTLAPLAVPGQPPSAGDDDMPKPFYYIASSNNPSGTVQSGQIWVRTGPDQPLRRVTGGQAQDYFAVDALDYNSPYVKSKPGAWFDTAFAEDNQVRNQNVSAHPWMGQAGVQ